MFSCDIKLLELEFGGHSCQTTIVAAAACLIIEIRILRCSICLNSFCGRLQKVVFIPVRHSEIRFVEKPEIKMSFRGGRGHRGRGKGRGGTFAGSTSASLTPDVEGRFARFCIWCSHTIENQALHKSREFRPLKG